MKLIKITFICMVVISAFLLNQSLFSNNNLDPTNISIINEAKAANLPDWCYYAPDAGTCPPTWIYVGPVFGLPACMPDQDKDLIVLYHCAIHLGQ